MTFFDRFLTLRIYFSLFYPFLVAQLLRGMVSFMFGSMASFKCPFCAGNKKC